MSLSEKTDKGEIAVVFGPTGLVGSELVMELIEDTNFSKVIAVSRREIPVSDSKLEIIRIDDFSQLNALKDRIKADTFFCCIGTTIRKAGTRENFRKTDLGIPEMIANLAQSLSVSNLAVISSIGASEKSSNFYLRTKGEMEQSVRRLFSGNLKIVRPSLLMGHRSEARTGERAAIVFMNLLGWMFTGPMKKYRGIKARDVARAMIKAVHFPGEKVIFDSKELHDIII